MPQTPRIIGKLKSLGKRGVSIYPILIIILIPALLVANTVWNLKAFNRDANFLVRHQAVSIADTLKPMIVSSINDVGTLKNFLTTSVNSNEDILSITLLTKEGEDFNIYVSSSNESDVENLKKLGLNQLAIGFNQPFAGLTYDADLQRKVWNVVVPLGGDVQTRLLHVKLDTQSVDDILSRTSNDSFIILAILIVVTLILLANHFYFYLRALKTKQLEELDKLKDEFVSMATHELRAPMTALTGYLELLRDKISPDQLPAIQADLTTLEGITNDLHNLIDDLLNVSRIDQRRLKVNAVDTNVNEVVAKVVEIMTPMTNQKGLQLKFTPTELPTIQTDTDRLRQIITNLVSNAVKYTLKGDVKISATLKKDNIEINVTDTGIGIQAEELSKLFTKFHRVKDSQTKEARGTGLGLWITKQMVELLGGKINAESIYGTGTSITRTLPIRRTA